MQTPSRIPLTLCLAADEQNRCCPSWDSPSPLWNEVAAVVDGVAVVAVSTARLCPGEGRGDPGRHREAGSGLCWRAENSCGRFPRATSFPPELALPRGAGGRC